MPDALVLGLDMNLSLLRLARRAAAGEALYPRAVSAWCTDRRRFPLDLPGAGRVDFWACDATCLPFPTASVDLAVALNLLDCVADRLRCSRCWRRRCAPAARPCSPRPTTGPPAHPAGGLDRRPLPARPARRRRRAALHLLLQARLAGAGGKCPFPLAHQAARPQHGAVRRPSPGAGPPRCLAGRRRAFTARSRISAIFYRAVCRPRSSMCGTPGCACCCNPSRAELGDAWLAAWLAAPVWHFGLGPGFLGDGQAWGVLIPSVDRVGRHFPFTIVGPASEGGQNLQDWVLAAEPLALSASTTAFFPMPWSRRSPMSARREAARPAPDPPAWRSPKTQATGPEAVDTAPGPAAGETLWWTRGAPAVPPRVLRWPGLPPAEMARSMIG
ncbi:MAG: type VI secretion system-associated protein TagF [Rhodospirillales bacterium]